MSIRPGVRFCDLSKCLGKMKLVAECKSAAQPVALDNEDGSDWLDKSPMSPKPVASTAEVEAMNAVSCSSRLFSDFLSNRSTSSHALQLCLPSRARLPPLPTARL